MQALLEAKKEGLTRNIGVSNFTIDLMQQAVDAVGAENIATNQIELSPYLHNRKVVDWAHEHNIHITSYMTLAYGKALEDEADLPHCSKAQCNSCAGHLGLGNEVGLCGDSFIYKT